MIANFLPPSLRPTWPRTGLSQPWEHLQLLSTLPTLLKVSSSIYAYILQPKSWATRFYNFKLAIGTFWFIACVHWNCFDGLPDLLLELCTRTKKDDPLRVATFQLVIKRCLTLDPVQPLQEPIRNLLAGQCAALAEELRLYIHEANTKYNYQNIPDYKDLTA